MKEMFKKSFGFFMGMYVATTVIRIIDHIAGDLAKDLEKAEAEESNFEEES